jgi:hypothetical protein
MRVRELQLNEKASAEPKKIKRDAFLYLGPKEPKKEFAQCSSCRLYLPERERCGILGPHVHVPAEASCGFYLHGEPTEDQECEAVVKPSEAGLVRRKVRCENCVSFDHGTCKLFKMLNETKPEIFDLDESINEKGCCNAQTPKT